MSTDSKAEVRIRERLMARQQELRARRERLEADRRREAEPLSTDAPDRAIQRANDEVVDSIEAAVNEELRAIGAALNRLEAGRYGICEACGAAIDARRLETVPYAPRCQSCATQT